MSISRVLVGESLGRAHVAVLGDLAELEKAVAPEAMETVVELRIRLATMDAHISEHFRFEEQGGYMDVARKREPRLERRVERLAEEHQELGRRLATLRAKAANADGLTESLRGEIREWIKSVRRHEASENDFVQDAFNLDLGAED